MTKTEFADPHKICEACKRLYDARTGTMTERDAKIIYISKGDGFCKKCSEDIFQEAAV